MDSDGAWEDLAGVGNLLKGLSAKYNNARDDFHELLFFLLHQYFVMKEKSRYWPYLALLPTANELDIPLFWSDQELSRRMTPSLLVDGMRDYRNKTIRSFESISALPQVQAFFESFERVLTYENYLWGTAILDSRSIWWNGKRHLVPMLDFVNCAEGPDPTKVHSTKLDDSERNAVTAASWAFAEGEQVFENYGQPNSIYFSYHGFSLPWGQNSHDCVQHELQTLVH
jgi:histone-lysine N-methyltransferase SETD3